MVDISFLQRIYQYHVEVSEGNDTVNYANRIGGTSNLSLQRQSWDLGTLNIAVLKKHVPTSNFKHLFLLLLLLLLDSTEHEVSGGGDVQTYFGHPLRRWRSSLKKILVFGGSRQLASGLLVLSYIHMYYTIIYIYTYYICIHILLYVVTLIIAGPTLLCPIWVPTHWQFLGWTIK